MNLVRLSLLLSIAALTGCNHMQSTLAPEYQGRVTPVARIGVGGPGAAVASQAFINAGYKTVDLGTTTPDVAAAGRQRGVPYVALVDSVDTSQAVWDGMYSFAMRVADANSGSIVWSSSATYGQAGILIDLQKSSREAYQAMVADFGKSFPPDR